MQEMQETQVQSLSQEDPLHQEMTTLSSIFAGKSHGQRSLMDYSLKGHKEPNMTKGLSAHTHTHTHTHTQYFTYEHEALGRNS